MYRIGRREFAKYEKGKPYHSKGAEGEGPSDSSEKTREAYQKPKRKEFSERTKHPKTQEEASSDGSQTTQPSTTSEQSSGKGEYKKQFDSPRGYKEKKGKFAGKTKEFSKNPREPSPRGKEAQVDSTTEKESTAETTTATTEAAPLPPPSTAATSTPTVEIDVKSETPTEKPKEKPEKRRKEKRHQKDDATPFDLNLLTSKNITPVPMTSGVVKIDEKGQSGIEQSEAGDDFIEIRYKKKTASEKKKLKESKEKIPREKKPYQKREGAPSTLEAHKTKKTPKERPNKQGHVNQATSTTTTGTTSEQAQPSSAPAVSEAKIEVPPPPTIPPWKKVETTVVPLAQIQQEESIKPEVVPEATKSQQKEEV